MSIISSVLHLVNGVDIDSLLKDINSLKTSLSAANQKIIGLNKLKVLLNYKYLIKKIFKE